MIKGNWGHSRPSRERRAPRYQQGKEAIQRSPTGMHEKTAQMTTAQMATRKWQSPGV